MQRVALYCRLTIGSVILCSGVCGSARAGERKPMEDPVAALPSELTTPWSRAAGAIGWKTSGIAVYAAGALYDLYTTKRAIDSGMREGNPLLSASGDRDRTLLRAAVAKIGFGFLIGRAGRARADRARGSWFLSIGAVQLGSGFANRAATIRERAIRSGGTPSTVIPPAPDPSRPGGVLPNLRVAKGKRPAGTLQ